MAYRSERCKESIGSIHGFSRYAYEFACTPERSIFPCDTRRSSFNHHRSLKVGKASATAANYVFSEIDRLDKEISELEYNIAVEADKHYGLSEVDIMYFLSHLKKQCGDLSNIENRKLIVNALVNSVFVYDDDKKITIIFNVSNQPPVQVDTALIDDIIKHNACSNTSESVPPFAP